MENQKTDKNIRNHYRSGYSFINNMYFVIYKTRWPTQKNTEKNICQTIALEKHLKSKFKI